MEIARKVQKLAHKVMRADDQQEDVWWNHSLKRKHSLFIGCMLIVLDAYRRPDTTGLMGFMQHFGLQGFFEPSPLLFDRNPAKAVWNDSKSEMFKSRLQKRRRFRERKIRKIGNFRR